ncbi:phosphate acetyltransferase [Kytococcus sp. Marseille-QA3725]
MSARTVMVASPEGNTGKSAIALALVDAAVGTVERVGVFRPVARAEDREDDPILRALLTHAGSTLTSADAIGVTYEEVHADEEQALADVVAAYYRVAEECDVVVVLGSDFTDVNGPTEFSFNARVAANLASPMVLVVHGDERTPEQVRSAAEACVHEAEAQHADVLGVVCNRVTSQDPQDVAAALGELGGGEAPVPVLGAVPDLPLLSAPTVRDVVKAVDGSLLWGDEAALDREVEDILVGGMNPEHILDRLSDGQLCIAASDRVEILLTLIAAHTSEGFPTLSAVVLNGGFEVSERVRELVQGLNLRLPVIETSGNTYETARAASTVRGLLGQGSGRKTAAALTHVSAHLDARAVLEQLDVRPTTAVTPLIFQHQLVEQAAASRRHIVLPEGSDDRILRAAGRVLTRGLVDLTILGEVEAMTRRAQELGVDLSAATLRDPADDPDSERLAELYTELRAHKGMTLSTARNVIADPNTFGTLLVRSGQCDGMVSGAAHTTAETIRPAFQVIGTAPGADVVSSCFLMCLADRVLVFADCAVIPEPTSEELAGIAVASAATARSFGIEPRVAMLSYSTGESGSGKEVEKVRAATELVTRQAPDLPVAGPIQYDAAVEPTVAASKLPDSDVAGRATVLVFPDLNTGNNTYKAVQRMAGALAVGPLLQGLDRPVNDLSRGALEDDIVNTILMTAVQAGTTDPGSNQ